MSRAQERLSHCAVKYIQLSVKYLDALSRQNISLQLNFSGQVDAIISEDSDTFCYGAITVLRNFSIVATGSSVEMYSMEKIGNLLSLTR